jgi:DNA-binding MarR family transcriptional regulator
MMQINDKPFNDTSEGLLHATRLFTRSTLLLQSAIAGKAGLNVTDAECIDFLLEMGPSTAGELARATMLTTGAITNVIDRLERAGLVRREKDAADRRKVIVRFLPEKHEKTHDYYSTLANDVRELCSGYSETEIAFLTRHMMVMKEVFDKNILKIIG